MHVLYCGEKAFTALDSAPAASANGAQRKPLAIVAKKARPQAGPQVRRFSGTRGAKDDKKLWLVARGEAAQHIHAAHEVYITAEEHCSVLRLKGLKPAVRCAPAEGAVRVTLQLECMGANAGLLKPTLQHHQSRLGNVDRRLLLRERMQRDETFGGRSGKPNDLPMFGERAGQPIQRDILGQKCEQLFVELVGELIFVVAPFRAQPILRNEEQHRLTTGSCIFQSAEPFFASGNTAIRVEIKKDVFRTTPAFANEPIAKSDCPIVVLARVADEKP